MKTLTTLSTALLITTFALAGCGNLQDAQTASLGTPAAEIAEGSDKRVPIKPKAQSNLDSVERVADLPECNADRYGQMTYVLEAMSFHRCGSTGWKLAPMKGDPDATHVLAAITEDLCADPEGKETCFFNGGHVTYFADGSAQLSVHALSVRTEQDGRVANSPVLDKDSLGNSLRIPATAETFTLRLVSQAPRGDRKANLYLIGERHTADRFLFSIAQDMGDRGSFQEMAKLQPVNLGGR